MSLSKSLPKGQVPIPCELCEVSFQIQWRCSDCKLLMCSKCKEKIHPKIKLAAEHKILKTKDITSEDLEDKPDLASVTCSVHDDKLCCLYCEDCDDAICLLCVTQTHSKHNMIELCEGYDICVKNVQSFTTQIDERIASIKCLERKRYEDEKIKILIQEQKLIEAIKSQTQILRKELEGHWINFEDVIRKELDASKYNRANIKIKSRIFDKEGHWKKSEEVIGSEHNDLKITTRIFDAVVHSRDANETFRVAREGIKLVNEEMARITADIGLPPTFIPRMILSTSIESVHGWLKAMHTKQPVVAAIEIGANTVGAALCLRSNYYKYLSKDIDKTFVNSPIEMVVLTDKKMYDIRSCVLLQPNGKVHSIGQEALYYYIENAKVITDWYFFDRLGEKIDKEKNISTNDIWLEESRDYTRCELKKMKAIDVLAAVLSYTKGKILSKLSMVGAGDTFYSEDILWMITKPTMRAEQFIRDAAKKADISNEITLIHEMDALSEFCGSIIREHKGIAPQTEIGDQCLVLNLGDGTTDITLHEITGPNFVKEIYRGDSWKGNALVREEILSILNQIFCQNVGSILKERNISEYIDLISNIEYSIERFVLESTGKITVRVPGGCLQELRTDPLQEFVSHPNVTIVKDRFRFTAPFFQSLFKSAINYASGILDKCISAINKENLSKITKLFVVGNCSKPLILVDVIKRRFEPSIEVVVLNADTPVLDGALFRGLQ
ncbi:unnamed protein product [Mytilus coruscus]|uniref:B box-type domain-containing protein n=1 Tax=Mytilus coruscus TaxID=42192 RepID=A0A6J8EY62_MYTCO|nr:unnamed protein product [Mytilus coruscus]